MTRQHSKRYVQRRDAQRETNENRLLTTHCPRTFYVTPRAFHDDLSLDITTRLGPWKAMIATDPQCTDCRFTATFKNNLHQDFPMWQGERRKTLRSVTVEDVVELATKQYGGDRKDRLRMCWLVWMCRMRRTGWRTSVRSGSCITRFQGYSLPVVSCDTMPIT